MGYLFFQILPLPLNILKFFSPEKYIFLTSNNEIVYSSISFSPSNSFFQILNFISLFLIVFILRMIFYTDRHKYRLYLFLSISGFVTSIIGVLFYLYGNPDFFIFRNSFYKEAASGFFINRTVFAVFLLFCLISSLELLKKLHKKNNFFLKIYIRLFVIFISIGIITSFSRIGNFLFFITIFVYLLNELFVSKNKNHSFKIIILFIIFFDLLFIGIYFGASEIIDRFYFLKEEFSHIPGPITTVARFDLIKFAFTEIKNFFFFGYGIGGFENIFQIKFINSYYWYADHAHSDLVEFFGEFGIIGILLFILSFIKFFLIKKNYSLINSLVLIYLSLILLFDFSLHIPIIQLLFIIFFYINKKSYGSSL